ncbi:hypothetical protein [Ekhidna sp.]
MNFKAVIAFLIIVAISQKSFGQEYSIEFSNQIFRNSLTNNDITLFEYKGDFNFNTQIVVVRTTNFGEVYAGIGFTSFNYITKLNVDEFDSPGDPAFQSFDDRIKNNGHNYLSIPFGVRMSLNEHFFIPVGITFNFELENRSNLFQRNFLIFNSGIGYKQPINEKFGIAIVPTFGLTLNPTATSFVKMPFVYGLRFNVNCKL